MAISEESLVFSDSILSTNVFQKTILPLDWKDPSEVGNSEIMKMEVGSSI